MALYNNGYPQFYPQNNNFNANFASYPQNQQQNNGIIWVQGEAGAKSYLVAPNTTVVLWDSETQTIYLKSADTSGMPSIKTLDYTIRNENQPIQGISPTDHNFISRDEFNGLKGEFEALKDELNKMKPHRKENKQNG